MKKIFLLMFCAVIILFAACKKESYDDDYRIMLNFYGTYECEKYVENYNVGVIVDIIPTEEDSTVYVRERTIYDLDVQLERETKCKVRIGMDGSFYGTMGDLNTPPPYGVGSYVEGCIFEDSLRMKMYLGYDTKPTIPDDSINIGIIRYVGARK